MTLPELCEPLFQYVCRLSRSGRMGRSPEMDQVRSDIKRVFDEMKTKASTSAELAGQYEKIELPLMFFVDFIVKESNLAFAGDWYELGRERNELAGDEKFFDLLDEELVDMSGAATQRLAVYYTCICLGFTGVYTGQPDSIERLVAKISARVSGMIDADEKSYVCPEAYENVDTRDFVEPPGAKLVGIGIALVCLIIVWSIAYLYSFWSTSHGVAKALETIKGYEVESVDGDNK